jgi:hypothetical protein
MGCFMVFWYGRTISFSLTKKTIFMGKKNSKELKHLQKGCKHGSKACCKLSRDHFKVYVIFSDGNQHKIKRKNKFWRSISRALKITGAVTWKLLKSKMI